MNPLKSDIIYEYPKGKEEKANSKCHYILQGTKQSRDAKWHLRFLDSPILFLYLLIHVFQAVIFSSWTWSEAALETAFPSHLYVAQ